jgi:hypothetical protein
MKFGTATAAKIPMIATTIINSIRVKPSLLRMVLRIFRIILSPPVWLIRDESLLIN